MNTGELNLLKKTLNELKTNRRINISYEELYNEFSNKDLKLILSSYHYHLINIFKNINKEIIGSHHYIKADPSREIIALIQEIKDFIGNIITVRLCLIEEYNILIKEIEKFIQSSGGTIIPNDFSIINIIETKSIFIKKNNIKKENKSLNLKSIGEGSYAKVYSFYDDFYNENFVLKRLKKNATEKEKERFFIEFKTMKKLNSLFIAKVYKIDEEKKEYIMEYLDTTLYNYIEKNNDNLTLEKRFKIIKQIILVFKYLDKQKILHRDISPKNILLKFYDDILCIKISDFGLVKLEESTLTDPNTDFKGSLNDPKLKDIGFNNYNSSYEMYALTRLISFVLTGKSNFGKIKNENILNFLKKGTSDNLNERYKNIDDLSENFQNLKKILLKNSI